MSEYKRTAMNTFFSCLGQQVGDAEEEAFLLFTRPIPSANLGFVDSRAPSVEVSLRETDYTIQQSPTLLSSSRAGGTTGAVLWKITPLFAEWISSVSSNSLWTHPYTPLSPRSRSTTVVELGCGISGLLALALGPKVGHYIATDQEYVHRLLRENLEENKALAYKSSSSSSSSGQKGQKGRGGQKKRTATAAASSQKGQHVDDSNISFTALDWELDEPDTLKQSVGIMPLTTTGKDEDEDEDEDKGFDLLLSCDCIYNEALIAPFVRTCADICRLRPAYNPEQVNGEAPGGKKNPTVCIIAQQQRSPDVFEAWLKETLKVFRVWRLHDEVLGDGLKSGTGYVVHLLVLREKIQ